MPVSEKKLRSNPAWIKRHLTDPFVKKSVQEGYRARSVYKLMEIDDKDKIIKPGMSVVDLGAAPGSWTQIVKERLTDKDGKIDGKVIAMVSCRWSRLKMSISCRATSESRKSQTS